MSVRGEPWAQGQIQLERDLSLGDPTLATVVAGSVDTNWWLLKKRGVLYNGLRIKIPNTRSGTWYTINVDAIDTSGSFPPLPSADDLYPFEIHISPPFRDPATTPRTVARAFATGSPSTYELELAPTPLPHEPVVLPEASVIDLASSRFPGLSLGTTTHFDLMFTSRGSVMGSPAASGLVHLYVTEIRSAEALRDFALENSSTLTGPVVPADQITLGGESVVVGDRRVLSLFTQTGAISTHPVDPSDSLINATGATGADSLADDPFFFAENGEVANKLMKSFNPPIQAARSGVTLTEVLMSILIMSIGVVGVAALFPVAILKSIQATQLTSATLARYNAEAAVDIFRSPSAGLEMSLVHDPDGDGNTVEHYRTAAARRYIVDPLGYFVHLEDVIDQNLGGDAPTSQVKDSGKAWQAWMGVQFTNASQGDISGIVTSDLLQRFDGGFEFQQASINAGATPNQNAPGIMPANLIDLKNQATAIVGTRDAWETHVDTEVDPSSFATDGAGNAIGVAVPADVDLTTIAATEARILLFDEEGQRSHSLPVVAIDNNILYWSETWDGNDTNGNGGVDDRALKPTALASELPLDSSLRLIAQVNEARRYSWFLTVRKGSAGQASVDVVVVFKPRVQRCE